MLTWKCKHDDEKQCRSNHVDDDINKSEMK